MVTGAEDGSWTLETLHGELVEHLERTTALSRPEAVRVLSDVMDYFAEDLPDLVRRRHRELASLGYANPAIFARLERELRAHRVVPPVLSRRQLRRAVYG